MFAACTQGRRTVRGTFEDDMFSFLSDPEAWASLATLTVMEVVLGIDNIIFLTILAGKLPEHKQNRARLVGLSLAAGIRLLLLLGISYLMAMTAPFFELFGHGFAGRDLILLAGGAFLIYKATREIHEKLEGPDEDERNTRVAVSFVGVIIQILLLDVVFSLDSVITAVGMTDHVGVMMVAVVISIGIMMAIGKPIGTFVLKHPTVKMLALSFLLLIGVSLAAEAFHKEIPKGYIYTAMAFSILVESLNLWSAKRSRLKGRKVPGPVALRRNVVGLELEEER
jgi:predicted tellurium resistance membrane protein TerC